MRESTVITVECAKGGCGKTTTALNLGAALAMEGKRVVLVDNDLQGNLTAALGRTPGELKHTLAKLLLTAIDEPEDVEPVLARTILSTGSGVDLIPANKRLSDAAARLRVMQLSQGRYEDEELSCEGVMREVTDRLQRRLNPKLKVAGILLTMYQSRPQLCQSVRDSVRELYGGTYHIFERPIEHTIKVAECPAAGVSILQYAPRNPAAESYRSLAREVLELG